MEPDFAVVECQNPAGYCRIAPCCTLRSAMREAVQAFLEKLDQYILQDPAPAESKIDRISYEESKVFVNLTKQAIQQAPEYHVAPDRTADEDTRDSATKL